MTFRDKLQVSSLSNLSRNFFRLVTIAQVEIGSTLCNDCMDFFLNNCKLQLYVAMCNMSSATCNGFLFLSCRYKLEELQLSLCKRCKPPKSCEISCKEGMLRAAIYLQLALLEKLQDKVHRVTLALGLSQNHEFYSFLLILRFFLLTPPHHNLNDACAI